MLVVFGTIEDDCFLTGGVCSELTIHLGFWLNEYCQRVQNIIPDNLCSLNHFNLTTLELDIHL